MLSGAWVRRIRLLLFVSVQFFNDLMKFFYIVAKFLPAVLILFYRWTDRTNQGGKINEKTFLCGAECIMEYAGRFI